MKYTWTSAPRTPFYRRARTTNLTGYDGWGSGCHKAKYYKISSYPLVFKNNSPCSSSILDTCLSHFPPCWSQGLRQPCVQLYDKTHLLLGAPLQSRWRCPRDRHLYFSVIPTGYLLFPSSSALICLMQWLGRASNNCTHTVKDTGCCEPRQPAVIAHSATASLAHPGQLIKGPDRSTTGRLKGSLQHQVQADREPGTERRRTWEHAVNSEAQPRGCGWYPDDDKGSGWKADNLATAKD